MFSAKPEGRLTRRRLVRGPGILSAGIALIALVTSACAPGASVAPSVSTPSSVPTASPSLGSAGSPSAAASPSAVAAGPNCGTGPVVLNATFETGFDIPFKLSEEFTKQYPNVTWNISQDQFTNLMTATPRLLSKKSGVPVKIQNRPL